MMHSEKHSLPVHRDKNSASTDRPGDIYHPDYTDGRQTYFDLSVTNTLQPGTINSSSNIAGEEGLQSDGRKDVRHADNVVETLGVWIPICPHIFLRGQLYTVDKT